MWDDCVGKVIELGGDFRIMRTEAGSHWRVGVNKVLAEELA